MWDKKSFEKKLTSLEALAKIQKYCAYQERSHQEVKSKLLSYGLRAVEADELISKLISDGFLNEERFAKAFAGGKFRIKKWGKNKIENELMLLGVSKRNIQTGLKEIDWTDYSKTLRNLLSKKSEQVEENNSFKKKDKLARYAIAKGYEPELVWEILKGEH